MIWQQGTEQIEYADRQKDARSLSTSPEDSFDNNFSLIEESLNQKTSNSDVDSFLFKSAVQLGEESLSDGLGTKLSSISFSNHTGAIRSIRLHQSQRLSKAYEMEFPDEPFLASHSRMTLEPCLESNCLIQGEFRLLENSLTKLCIDGKLQAIYKLIESMNGQIQMAMVSTTGLFLKAFEKLLWRLSGSGSIWGQVFRFPECTIHLTKHPLI